MKKVSLKIQILLLIPMLCISVISFSQVPKSKQEKKEAKEAQKAMDYQELRSFLEKKKIEYQTEIIQESTGAKVFNVVQINGSRFYMRCENPQNTSGGSSGARDNTTPAISPKTGIFFEGDIKDWELTESPKNKCYIVKFNALTRTGLPWGEIMMKAYADKSADIEIRSNSGSMIYTNYTGYVRPF